MDPRWRHLFWEPTGRALLPGGAYHGGSSGSLRGRGRPGATRGRRVCQLSEGLAYPIQVLVRALPIDLAPYARRLEDRAADLPPTLAASARADAVWARQTGPGLGLLDRRAFLVLPAEAPPDEDLIRRLGSARTRLGRLFGTASGTDEGTARQVLDARCAEAIDMLAGAGIWAHRLDDPDLVRLFHSCWSRGQSARFEQALGTCLRPLAEGGA